MMDRPSAMFIFCCISFLLAPSTAGQFSQNPLYTPDTLPGAQNGEKLPGFMVSKLTPTHMTTDVSHTMRDGHSCHVMQRACCVVSCRVESCGVVSRSVICPRRVCPDV